MPDGAGGGGTAPPLRLARFAEDLVHNRAMALTRNPPPTNKPPFELVEPLGFLRLYLDDLDTLLGFLQARAESVTLSAGRATADAAIDLRAATPAELRSVAIQTHGPNTTIWLSSGRAEMRTADDSEASQALVADFVALTASHRGGQAAAYWNVFAAVGWIGVLLTGIGAMLLIFQALDAAEDWASTPAVGWGAVVLGLIGAFGLTGLVWRDQKRPGGVTIYPRLRSESRETSAKSRTALITGIIVAIVTAVATALFTLWLVP